MACYIVFIPSRKSNGFAWPLINFIIYQIVNSKLEHLDACEEKDFVAWEFVRSWCHGENCFLGKLISNVFLKDFLNQVREPIWMMFRCLLLTYSCNWFRWRQFFLIFHSGSKRSSDFNSLKISKYEIKINHLRYTYNVFQQARKTKCFFKQMLGNCCHCLSRFEDYLTKYAFSHAEDFTFLKI